MSYGEHEINTLGGFDCPDCLGYERTIDRLNKEIDCIQSDNRKLSDRVMELECNIIEYECLLSKLKGSVNEK